MNRVVIKFLAGFLLLFVVYHFPEFFPVFWVMAVFKIGFLLVAFVLGRLQGWKGLEGYGLGFSKRWWQHLLQGLFIGIFFFSVSVLVSVLVRYEEFNGIASIDVVIKGLPMLLLMTSFPSIAEDILTRGYLYGHLFNKMKPWHWVLLSAVVYVLNHIWRLNEDPSVLVYLFLLGVVLASAVWKTKSLWLAFGIHWGANLAFESSHSFVETKPLVTHYGSTWLMAASWLLLVILFGITAKPKATLRS